MDVLGLFFLVALAFGALLGGTAFVTTTLDRLNTLEGRLDDRDAADDCVVQRRRVEAVLGADHAKVGEIMEIFES